MASGPLASNLTEVMPWLQGESFSASSASSPVQSALLQEEREEVMALSLITSQIDTAPKLYEAHSFLQRCLITSQIDTAPKLV